MINVHYTYLGEVKKVVAGYVYQPVVFVNHDLAYVSGIREFWTSFYLN